MSSKGSKGSKGCKKPKAKKTQKRSNNYNACSIDDKIAKGSEELEQLEEKKSEVEKRIVCCKQNMKMVKLAISKAEEEVGCLIKRHFANAMQENLDFEIASIKNDQKRSEALVSFYAKQCEALSTKLKLHD